MSGLSPAQTVPTLHLELTSCCQDFYIKVIQPVTDSGVSGRTSLLIITELGMSWLCFILHHISANNLSLPPLLFRNVCLYEPGLAQGFFQKIKREFSRCCLYSGQTLGFYKVELTRITTDKKKQRCYMV